MRCAKGFKAIAVITVEAVFSAYPEEADVVLIDSANGEVVQAFSGAKAAEAVFLGAKQAACQRQQGQGKRDCFM